MQRMLPGELSSNDLQQILGETRTVSIHLHVGSTDCTKAYLQKSDMI